MKYIFLYQTTDTKQLPIYLFFRSLFDSDSVLVEATQLSNETLNVEVAVKLPASVKGKLFTCVRYFECCVKPRPNVRNTFNATYRNIVGRNTLHPFGYPVVTCCDFLDVVGSSFIVVKFESTIPNMSQHVTTGWPNARNMLRPTVLGYAASKCCDHLVGALHY